MRTAENAAARCEVRSFAGGCVRAAALSGCGKITVQPVTDHATMRLPAACGDAGKCFPAPPTRRQKAQPASAFPPKHTAKGPENQAVLRPFLPCGTPCAAKCRLRPPPRCACRPAAVGHLPVRLLAEAAAMQWRQRGQKSDSPGRAVRREAIAAGRTFRRPCPVNPAGSAPDGAA